MKQIRQKLLALLLTAVMLLGLLPSTALALDEDTADYTLFIQDNTLYKNSALGDRVSVDGITETEDGLIFYNVSFTSSANPAVKFSGDNTITLKGANTLACTAPPAGEYTVLCTCKLENADITLRTEEGSDAGLTVTGADNDDAGSYAIEVGSGSLNVGDGVTLTVQAGAPKEGFCGTGIYMDTFAGTLTISGQVEVHGAGTYGIGLCTNQTDPLTLEPGGSLVASGGVHSVVGTVENVLKDLMTGGTTVLGDTDASGANAAAITGESVDWDSYKYVSCSRAASSSAHSHCVCGAAHSAIGDHTDEDTRTWQAWTESDKLPETAGNYYLTKDVTLRAMQEINSDIALCLNGHTISGSSRYRAVNVAANKTLILTDCQGGGKLTDGYGVVIYGTLLMYGGSIEGNTTPDNGGGVSLAGSDTVFRMYGGSIANNTANDRVGGGVSVGGGEAYLYGGSITGNTARIGGGVYVGTGYSLYMYGGSISGNKATSANSAGGGVHMCDHSSSHLHVSGKVIIQDNTRGSDDSATASNVYLASTYSLNNWIVFDDALAEGSFIGVTTGKVPTANSALDITGSATADYSKYFSSDNPDYTVAVRGSNVVQLKAPAPSLAQIERGGSAAGSYDSLSAALSAAQSGDTVRVIADVTGSGNAIIPEGKGITLTANEGVTVAYDVYNNDAGSTIAGGTYTGSVDNSGVITGGVFNGKVSNGQGGVIQGGTFNDTSDSLNNNGTIAGGTFKSQINLVDGGTVTGGSFDTSLEENIYFQNGSIDLSGATLADDFTLKVGNRKTDPASSMTVTIGTDIKLPSGFAAHDSSGRVVTTFSTNQIVTIKKAAPAPAHSHTLQTGDQWTYDPSGHWRQCTDPSCPDVNGSKADSANHVWRWSSTSPMPSDYQHDATHHWVACTVCGYQNYKSQHRDDGGGWQRSATKHWKYCMACGGTVFNEGDHQYGDNGSAQSCTVCGYKPPAHKHAVSVGCEADSGTQVEFTAWSTADAMPDTAGNYVLTCDVELASTWSVPTGTTNLCLNGHVLSYTGSSYVINLQDGRTLNLCDCQTTAHKFTANEYGNWSLDPSGDRTAAGGVITSCKSPHTSTTGVNIRGGSLTMCGGNIVGNTQGVCLMNWTNLGSFTMEGGSIQGNYGADGGAGVKISGDSATTFTMKGGAIDNNTASGRDGGGVYLMKGTFNLEGGSIANNRSLSTSSMGGGIRVSMNGTFNMTGGSITGNSATHGGGIYMAGDAKVTLSGGSITGNQAGYQQFGGGIYYDGAYVSSGYLRLKGAPVIQDNTRGRDEAASDIYLAGGAVMTIGARDAKLTRPAKPIVIGASGAKQTVTTVTSDWGNRMNSGEEYKNYANYFKSDSSDYALGLETTHYELTLGTSAEGPSTHTHAWATAWSKNDTHHWHACTADGCDITDYTENQYAAQTSLAPHTKTWVSTDPAQHWQTCAICGWADEKADHVYDNDQDATCNTCGYERSVTQPTPDQGDVTGEVEVKPDTPAVTVDKDALRDLAGEVPAGQTVTVKLTVEKQDSPADKDALEAVISGKKDDVLYLDLSLLKQVNDAAPEAISDTGDKVLEVKVPYDFTGKKDVTVYRKHGENDVEKLTALAARPTENYADGSFFADSANGVVYIYASKFSTYAIGYTLEQSNPTPSRRPSGGRPGTVWPAAWPFTDVKTTDSCYEAVKYVYEKGWMLGTSDTTFAPEGQLTRAMLATVLYRAAGSPKVEGAPEFEDTKADQWYSDAVVWAAQTQVLRGYGNGSFGPNDPVSKEMLNMVVGRQKGEDPVWVGDPALAAPAARAEIAAMLMEHSQGEK